MRADPSIVPQPVAVPDPVAVPGPVAVPEPVAVHDTVGVSDPVGAAGEPDPALGADGGAARARAGFGRGLAFGTAAVLMWGAQFPVAKSAFAQVDAFQTTAMRYAIPTLLLLAMLWRTEGAAALRYGRRWAAAAWLGVIGMCASPAFVFGGLMLTRPEIAAILIATQPTMTALAQWRLRGVRPSRFTLGCIAVAFAGVIAVVTRLDASRAPAGDELAGDLLVLVGAVCWVAYTLGLERFRGWSTLRVTTLTMVPGTLANLGLVAGGLALGWITPVPVAGWLAVAPQMLYLALAGVLAGMLCWNAGAQRIGALNAMLLLNLVPVVAFAIRFAQGQRFVAAELAGAALVVGALVASNLRQRSLAARAAAGVAVPAATSPVGRRARR